MSPRILNAAFEAALLDWVFVAFPVAGGRTADAVAGARALGIRGVSVTMPHKAAVIPALDGLTATASELGAVNCILRAPHDDGLLLGDNTDGVGFLRALRADFDVDAAGLRCVVIGAGGAGRAVAHALGGAGATSVAVVNRDAERGRRAAALAATVGFHVDARNLDDVHSAVGAADLLVNATPVGMDVGASSGPDLPVPEEVLRSDLIVADLVYHPTVTPLLAAAARCGAPHANGVSMLVHQAAVAFERWTSVEAPTEAMTAAAVGAVTD